MICKCAFLFLSPFFFVLLLLPECRQLNGVQSSLFFAPVTSAPECHRDERGTWDMGHGTWHMEHRKEEPHPMQPTGEIILNTHPAIAGLSFVVSIAAVSQMA